MTAPILPWKKQPLDGEVARSIRHDIRMHRRERGRAGHRFRYDDLQVLWAASNKYAVLRHLSDPVWQFFYNHPTEGWKLISWHFTRREAQVAACQPIPEPKVKAQPVKEGIHVLAGWPKKKKTMRVPCSSPETAGAVEAAFLHLGCEVKRELVTI